MSQDQSFPSASDLAHHFRQLHARRRAQVAAAREKRLARTPLTKAERAQILLKSDGRCHICGGKIDGAPWDADHVFAHSAGGAHSLDNYLPAHKLCNQFRWNYDHEEFQWILKLGVWLRGQIESETPIGVTAAKAYLKYDHRRAARRKPR